MNNGPPLKKSWQRWTWLMTVTLGMFGLIVYDAILKGSVNESALGAIVMVITLAAKQLFDSHDTDEKAPPQA